MDEQPIGVCVLVIDPTGKKILLAKRKNSYKAGTYGLPGGRLHLNEPLEDCGTRELLEETGLQAQSLIYRGVIREKQEAVTFIHFVFSCTEFTGDPQLKEPDKSEEWNWYNLDNLPTPLLPGHAAAVDMYQRGWLLKDLL